MGATKKDFDDTVAIRELAGAVAVRWIELTRRPYFFRGTCYPQVNMKKIEGLSNLDA